MKCGVSSGQLKSICTCWYEAGLKDETLTIPWSERAVIIWKEKHRANIWLSEIHTGYFGRQGVGMA